MLYRAGLRCAEALALETRTRLRLRGRLVFTTLDGRPLQASYVRALVSRLACKAGIDKRVHPHELRHTCAFELAGAMQRRSWTAS